MISTVKESGKGSQIIKMALDSFIGGQVNSNILDQSSNHILDDSLKRAVNVILTANGQLTKRDGIRNVMVSNGIKEDKDLKKHLLIPILTGDGKDGMFYIHNLYDNQQRIHYLENGEVKSTKDVYLINWEDKEVVDYKEFKYCQANDSIILTHPLFHPILLKVEAGEITFAGRYPVSGYPRQRFYFEDVILSEYGDFYVEIDKASGDDVQLKLSASTANEPSLNEVPEFFNQDSVGTFLQFLGGGFAEIISVNTSQNSMVLKTSSDIVLSTEEGRTPKKFKSSEIKQQKGFENPWTEERGYPRCSILYRERVYFGGINTVWASAVGEPYNFDNTLDPQASSSAIAYGLTGSNSSVVNFASSNQGLQALTTNQEYLLRDITRTQGLSLSTTEFVPTTNHGSATWLPAVQINGTTKFVEYAIFGQEGKTAVREFMYRDNRDNYIARDISVNHSDLIKTPISFCLAKSSTSYDSLDVAYTVNRDGTACIYIEEEPKFDNQRGINAWFPMEMQGKFKDISASRANIYVVYVTEEGGDLCLGVFDKKCYLDHSRKIQAEEKTNTFEVDTADPYYTPAMTSGEIEIRSGEDVLENEKIEDNKITLSNGITRKEIEIGTGFGIEIETTHLSRTKKEYGFSTQADNIIPHKIYLCLGKTGILDSEMLDTQNNVIQFNHPKAKDKKLGETPFAKNHYEDFTLSTGSDKQATVKFKMPKPVAFNLYSITIKLTIVET